MVFAPLGMTGSQDIAAVVNFVCFVLAGLALTVAYLRAGTSRRS